MLGISLAWLFGRVITESALKEAREVARDTVGRRMLAELRPGDLASPLSPDRMARIDAFVRDVVVSDRTARVKIWALDGRVVYANDPSIIGQVFPPDQELGDAIQGQTVSELNSAAAKAENIAEMGLGALLEVYTPIVFPDTARVAGVFEIYQYYLPIARQIADVQRLTTLALVGGLSILYLALLGIVHGGTRTIERQQRALEEAVDDVRTLNADLERRVVERTADLAVARDQYQYLASHDPLTDLFNRRRFEEELELQLAQVKRYGGRGALIFFDLDHFKTINDSLGHRAGDDLLVKIADLLRGRLRQSDIPARLGGDEFAVFLPRADGKEAQGVAERVLEALTNEQAEVAGAPLRVAASIGIALVPDHGSTRQELLTHADLAMYQAKEQGRGQIRLYDPTFDFRFTEEQRIREYLQREQIVLHGQPILDVRTNQISHYEVLARLGAEDGLLIQPFEFLPVAERFGLMTMVDRWIARESIRLAGQHHRAGRDLTLEVNLSGTAFEDTELLDLIRREIELADIRPAQLIFEWPESFTHADFRQAYQFISALKAMGCRFALDDFGTGFSSFYYLKRLPVDYVKIDGRFIANLSNDTTDQHLVRAIIEVATGLSKETIAESVENEASLNLLRQYGAQYAQGFHIARPAPLSDLLPPLPFTETL